MSAQEHLSQGQFSLDPDDPVMRDWLHAVTPKTEEPRKPSSWRDRPMYKYDSATGQSSWEPMG